MWPMLLDYSRDDCKRMLRKYELEAYASVVTALRAQGDLNVDKKNVLNELCSLLSISLERHRAEVRRAVNDERLNTIAHYVSGPNTSIEWCIEGRRLIPLLPRLVPQTAFTGVANMSANIQQAKNSLLPVPAATGLKVIDNNVDDVLCNNNNVKRRRIEGQSSMSIQGQPTIVPIKATSVQGQMMVPTIASIHPNHKVMTQSGVTATSKTLVSTRTVVSACNPENSYAMTSGAVTMTTSGAPVAQTGTRVIFVSSTPASSSNLSSATKVSTSFPIIARHAIASPSRQSIQIPSPRPGIPRNARPTINTSVAGLVAVSGGQKQIKAPVIKSTTTIGSPSNATQAVTTIPFPQGTKVFTKTGGQQQVVVFPVTQKPVTVPLNQSIKSFSVPASSNNTSSTLSNPTIIYQQSPSNIKAVQKTLQAPNLIIMQPKQMIQATTKSTPISTTAVTLSATKTSFKTQNRSQILSPKKLVSGFIKNAESTGSNEPKNTQDSKSSSVVEKLPAQQIFATTSITKITESPSRSPPKITAKKLQPTTSAFQEIGVLSEFAEGEIIEIDGSTETIAGLINSVKSGHISSKEILELVNQAVEKDQSSKPASGEKNTDAKKENSKVESSLRDAATKVSTSNLSEEVPSTSCDDNNEG